MSVPNVVYFSPSSAHRLPSHLAQEMAEVREELLHYPPFQALIEEQISSIDEILRVGIYPHSLPGFLTINLITTSHFSVYLDVSSLDGPIYQAAQFMAGQNVPKPLFPPPEEQIAEPPNYQSIAPQQNVSNDTLKAIKAMASIFKEFASIQRIAIEALANNSHCSHNQPPAINITNNYYLNTAPFAQLSNSPHFQNPSQSNLQPARFAPLNSPFRADSPEQKTPSLSPYLTNLTHPQQRPRTHQSNRR